MPADLFPSQSVAGGGGFRLRHVGSPDLVFFAEDDDDARRWTEALVEAVAFS